MSVSVSDPSRTVFLFPCRRSPRITWGLTKYARYLFRLQLAVAFSTTEICRWMKSIPSTMRYRHKLGSWQRRIENNCPCVPCWSSWTAQSTSARTKNMFKSVKQHSMLEKLLQFVVERPPLHTFSLVFILPRDVVIPPRYSPITRAANPTCTTLSSSANCSFHAMRPHIIKYSLCDMSSVAFAFFMLSQSI